MPSKGHTYQQGCDEHLMLIGPAETLALLQLQRKLAAEQAQALALAQQTDGSGASSAQRGLPGFNPAASLQNGQVCACIPHVQCS